jgi:hypothetical protein
LKHKNTQPIYIFNRKNPQNSEPQNGPRRGLDFIALHKGTDTRNSFEILRMFNYMFGDALWDHLVVEVTFWENGEDADNKRKRGSPDTYTNDLMATKLNDLISDTANVPQDLNIPIVFINPVFDIESLVSIPENVPQLVVDHYVSLRQPLIDLQENEISKLKEHFFESNIQGFGCSDNCKGVIPPKAGRPFLVDDSVVGTISKAHYSDLTIKCLVPIPFDAIQTGGCDHVCEPGWILNDTHQIPADKIKHETDPSGFMTTNTLQLLSLDKDQDPGSYRVSHGKTVFLKLGLRDRNMQVRFFWKVV